MVPLLLATPLMSRRAARAGVDTAMYQPAIPAQKVDFVDIDVALPTELDGDRLGALLGRLRAQQGEGIGELVGDDLLARLGRAETGALRDRAICVLRHGSARGGHRQDQKRDAENAHVANLSQAG